MKTKNILLTTLLKMEGDRLQHRYFYFDDGKERTYCDSIIIPEAGAKYILSKELIDEILVLGDGSTCLPEEQMRPMELGDPKDYSELNILAMPEYNFFRYRMSQYMEGYDLEGLDVLENIDPERKAALISLYDEISEDLRRQYPKTYQSGREFHFISSDEYLFTRIRERLNGTGREQDLRWLKRYAYTKLDKTKKMHILDANKDVKVYFVPTKKSRGGRLDNLPAIMNAISEDGEMEVNLYMDMQGIGASDGFTLISLMLLLNDDASSHLHVRQLITTHYDPSNFTNPIDNNDMARYELNMLVSGVNAFVQYGKVDIITEYWRNTGLHNEHIERLLFGMRCVDDGISLCHIGCLETGISVLKDVFNLPAENDLSELTSSIFEILEKSIRADYGALLDGDELDIVALLRWSYRKRFYQQALTIIESKVPDDMVTSGLLYYARDDESRDKMLDSLQKLYADTPQFQRWSFDDINHYFLKYYVIRKVSPRQPTEKRAIDYSELMAGALDPDTAAVQDMCPVYSMVADKPDLLKETLRTYFLIGPMRNQINHASKDWITGAVVAENKPENPIITLIKDTLDDFITSYATIKELVNERKAAEGAPPVVLISGEEFKQYSAAHKYDYPDCERRGGFNKNNRGNNNRGGGYGGNDRNRSINVGPGSEIHIHIHLDK